MQAPVLRSRVIVALTVAMAGLWLLAPVALADVPVTVQFDPPRGVPGTLVTVQYDPCNREGGRAPGEDLLWFSKSTNPPSPPFLASAVLTLVKEGRRCPTV